MPTLQLRPMRARDTEQAHRAATPLELFFDLTFVVAVSFAATGLAHQIEDGHALRGVAYYLMVFFGIWWGWINFTWFASAYDTDDWLYRLVTLVQMGGALTVAAGIPRAFEHRDFTVMVVGYVIMRLAMVSQWLRVARSDPPSRGIALTYAAGVTAVQVLWCAWLAVPRGGLAIVCFVVLLCCEILVPVVAERRELTAFHRGHIAERFSLFTLIVLGEGVLAAGNSIIESIQDGEHVGTLTTLAISGLATLAAMWWLYFSADSGSELVGRRRTFTWGYGHYAVFASAAAVSSALEAQVAFVTEAHPSASVARLSLALPLALFMLLTWALVLHASLNGLGQAVVLGGAALVVAAGLLPWDPPRCTVAGAAVLALVVAGVTARGGVGDRAGLPNGAST